MGIDLIVRRMVPTTMAMSGVGQHYTLLLSARLLVAVTVLVSASADTYGNEPSNGAIGFDEAVLVRTTHLSFDRPPSEAAAAPANAAVSLLGEFSKTTWVQNVYGSAIFGDSGKGQMYLGHVGFGYYFEDYEAINLDFFGGHVRSGIDDDGGVIGLDVLYRNHFLRSEDDRHTVFFDGGLGLQQASTNFSGDRHFNFRIMFGFGGSLQIDNNARLFVGCRYIHISDAGIEGGGGGFDGPMVYVGMAFPF